MQRYIKWGLRQSMVQRIITNGDSFSSLFRATSCWAAGERPAAAESHVCLRRWWRPKPELKKIVCSFNCIHTLMWNCFALTDLVLFIVVWVGSKLSWFSFVWSRRVIASLHNVPMATERLLLSQVNLKYLNNFLWRHLWLVCADYKTCRTRICGFFF